MHASAASSAAAEVDRATVCAAWRPIARAAAGARSWPCNCWRSTPPSATPSSGTSPHRLCTYLFDLAQDFTAFYEACPVLKAPTDELRLSRLALADLTARVLAHGLSTCSASRRRSACSAAR